MRYLSYAQNQEDVILQKVFESVPNGFYVDIGAFHPTIDSITKVFYDKGWRGVNVEPIEQSFEKIVDARPRDLNFNIAISNVSGTKVIHYDENLGLATLETNVAADLQMKLSENTRIEPLNFVFSKLATIPEIHFLKIDVEGHEKEVLEGFDFEKYAPWVLIIESIDAQSHNNTSADWEHLIPEDRYKFVYFDGLNNFYLHKNYLNLEKFFNRINVLVPGYISGSEFELSEKFNAEVAQNTDLENELKSMQSHIADLTIKISLLETRISWLGDKHDSQDLLESLFVMQERIQYLSQIQLQLIADRDLKYRELTDAIRLRDAYFLQLSDIYNRRIWKLAQPFFKIWRIFLRIQFGMRNLDKAFFILDARIRRYPKLRRFAIGLIYKTPFAENLVLRLYTKKETSFIDTGLPETSNEIEYIPLSQVQFYLRNS